MIDSLCLGPTSFLPSCFGVAAKTVRFGVPRTIVVKVHEEQVTGTECDADSPKDHHRLSLKTNMRTHTHTQGRTTHWLCKELKIHCPKDPSSPGPSDAITGFRGLAIGGLGLLGARHVAKWVRNRHLKSTENSRTFGEFLENFTAEMKAPRTLQLQVAIALCIIFYCGFSAASKVDLEGNCM